MLLEPGYLSCAVSGRGQFDFLMAGLLHWRLEKNETQLCSYAPTCCCLGDYMIFPMTHHFLLFEAHF